jgi:predicted Fe-S protein YdhL (DUF1289 family)
MARANLASSVPSPCVSICTMDPVTGLCTGCQRTIDEIASWSVLDDEARREVWQRIFARRDEAVARDTDDDGT